MCSVIWKCNDKIKNMCTRKCFQQCKCTKYNENGFIIKWFHLSNLMRSIKNRDSLFTRKIGYWDNVWKHPRGRQIDMYWVVGSVFVVSIHLPVNKIFSRQWSRFILLVPFRFLIPICSSKNGLYLLVVLVLSLYIVVVYITYMCLVKFGVRCQYVNRIKMWVF